MFKYAISCFCLFTWLQVWTQVDEPKMRQKTYYSYAKEQENGYLTQRSSILSKLDAWTYPFGFQQQNMLESQSEFRFISAGNEPLRFVNRNRVISFINARYDGIEFRFSDPAVQQIFLNSIHENELAQAEIFYGDNISYRSFHDAQICLASKIQHKPVRNNEMNLSLFANQDVIVPHITLFKKWNNFVWRGTLDANLGKDTASMWNGKTVHLKSQLKWNVSTSEEIYLYLHSIVGEQQYQSQFALEEQQNIQVESNYKPILAGAILYTKISDTHSLFSSIRSSLNFTFTQTSNLNKVKFAQGLIHHRMAEEEASLLWQNDLHKNLNARHVFFYGLHMEGKQRKEQIGQINPYKRTRKIDLMTYFRHELRPSSDVSWLYGAQLSAVYLGIDTHVFLRPNIKLNISWVRHTCEASNYSINFYAKYRYPEWQELTGSIFGAIAKPNYLLLPEKELSIDANLYRMYEDKLEIHLTPFLRYRRDGIAAKDYNKDTSSNSQIENFTYYPYGYDQIDQLLDYGFQSELKYHVYKNFTVYSQIGWGQTNRRFDSSFYELNQPWRMTIGTKIKTGIFLGQLLWQYNALVSQGTSNSRYVQNSNQGSIVFPELSKLVAILRVSLNSKWNISGQLEQILSANRKPFLSTIELPNQRWTLGLNFNL